MLKLLDEDISGSVAFPQLVKVSKDLTISGTQLTVIELPSLMNVGGNLLLEVLVVYAFCVLFVCCLCAVFVPCLRITRTVICKYLLVCMCMSVYMYRGMMT